MLQDSGTRMTQTPQTNQERVIEFLSQPGAHGGRPVERIETHASMVFLAGDRAWKLKRAVTYPYLDFSTLDRRKASCEAELAINRRTAPAMYLGVVPVTGHADGTMALGGDGEPIEWLIEMVRFDQALLLDRLASRGELDRTLMAPLADAIADLHLTAEPLPAFGGRQSMQWVIDGNAEDLTGLDQAQSEIRDMLIRESRDALVRHGTLLDQRCRNGWVRRCHGDLHLRNIVLLDGVPTLFDGVEFNDRISCIDVLYDLAFLLMDLWRRELPHHANAVWNRYLTRLPDRSGLPALPLFLSCRAAVRAKTSLAAARLQNDEQKVRDLQQTSRTYLDLALALLRARGPFLLAVGGLSGSGKSSLAFELAPGVGAVPGAVVLRSDEIRKELAGVPAHARLPQAGYSESMSRQVYGELSRRAAAVLEAGHGVIADAVFARPEDRESIARTAEQLSVPFAGVWLDAPEQVLVERVRARRGDASDADVAVVRQQLARSLGSIAWHRIDAGAGLPAVAAAARQILGIP
jgi:uncharacterized protein